MQFTGAKQCMTKHLATKYAREIYIRQHHITLLKVMLFLSNIAFASLKKFVQIHLL